MPRIRKAALSKTPPLPAEVQRALDELALQLHTVATEGRGYWGAPGRGGLVDTLAAAYSAAVAARQPEESGELSRIVNFGELIAERIRRAREDAGWTQAQLAQAMAAAGADWKRITVAEAEAGTRRVSLDELFLLSILFAIPMVSFLLPAEGDEGDTTEEAARADFFQLPEGTRCYRTLDPNTARELILGKGGLEGSGGVEWEAAASVAGGPAGDDSWRPAHALWAARGPHQRTEGSTP